MPAIYFILKSHHLICAAGTYRAAPARNVGVFFFALEGRLRDQAAVHAQCLAA
jgi:hypothetical protein